MPVKRKVTELQLRTLIEADRSTGIPAEKGGKINRAHYARLLGCTRSTLTSYVHVFSEYEQQLSIATGPMRHFSEMRTWLEEAYSLKQLDFNGRILERITFAEHFKLRGNTTFMIRHESIRNLFSEFEARAKSENYVSAVKKADLDRLKSALAAKPALNSDRLTINRTALAEELAWPINKFKGPEFLSLIKEKEIEILCAAKENKVDPYFHGRVFAFSVLSPPWPMKFLERVGGRFLIAYSGKAKGHANQAYLQLHDAFSFIGTSDDQHCRQVLKEANEHNRVHDHDAWEEALHLYRAHVLSHIKTGSLCADSADAIISILRCTFADLAPSVVPETSVPLPGVRLARFRSGHLRSLAETGTKAETTTGVDYAKFASERLREINDTFGVVLEAGDSASFLESLSFESAYASSAPSNIPTAVRQLLERRLNLLRDKALAILDDAIKAYDRGKELLSTSRIDAEEFEREYFEREPGNQKRQQVLRVHFPELENASAENATLGVANLLRLIEQQHAGVPPESGNHQIGPHGQFFGKRYLEYGGLKTIISMLIPAAEVAGAVLTLYLIESGANVGVGRTLEEDCLETSDLEGYKRITGNKARAKGKPIIIDLAEHSPAIRAINWFRSASGRLRACAGDDSDRLFLMRMGGRAQLMKPNWYTDWFKRFVATIPALSDLRLTPNMLRPSVLLHASLSNDGRLATGLAMGQHGLAVSQTYQIKFPTRLLYDANIRRFHAAFETLVMPDVEDAAKKLGITSEEFSARLGNMRSTGLGTFCRDQRGRPGHTPDGKCSTLDCWNDCPNLMIVAEVESIAALQIWQSSLRSVEPEWERDRPERWDQVWLPWLCLTDVVSEKMARGPQLKIWNQAKALAAEISSRPNFVSPKPW